MKDHTLEAWSFCGSLYNQAISLRTYPEKMCYSEHNKI